MTIQVTFKIQKPSSCISIQVTLKTPNTTVDKSGYKWIKVDIQVDRSGFKWIKMNLSGL